MRTLWWRNAAAAGAVVAAAVVLLRSQALQRAYYGLAGLALLVSVAATLSVIERRGRTKLQADLAFHTKYDALTGLPNRAQACERIAAALSRAQRSGQLVGLLLVDLDGFKTINAKQGHFAGDYVLRLVATRLHEEVRSGDVVGRLGGDEFVVLLEHLVDESDAMRLADRLITATAEPVSLPTGAVVHFDVSIGMALAQDGNVDAHRLLQEVDIAAHRAKDAGGARVEVFGDALRDELTGRLQLEAALMQAIEQNELVLHYQPIVDVVTTETLGYEALVRWDRPGVGLIPPAQFIPVAEASALICDLDAWVLRQACEQLATWLDRDDNPLTMAVNISARHLGSPRIVDDVREALTASRLPGNRLVLEITETVFVENLASMHHLHELRMLGVAISIDDFGTGYSSIMRLRGLPVDLVKIDRSFLDDTPDAPSRKLLELMIHAAHAYEIPVVVEGVEHQHQLQMLRELDVEAAQGFHLCRPLPAEKFVHASGPCRAASSSALRR